MFTSFHIPPTVLIGDGTRQELVPVARRLGGTRALLVTDDVLVEEGVAPHFASQLSAAGIPTATFSSVRPDPTEQNVLDGLAALRAADADFLVALGGGSPIDCAKAIAVLATNLGGVRDYAGNERIGVPPLPLIAVPTTAGSGTEVARVCVITDPHKRERITITSVHCVPAAALVDYELTLSLPSHLTAAAGMDALSHGIEAYVSRKANGLTNPLALSCIRLVGQHLLTAYSEPNQRFARAGMALAACQGGMVFGNASLGLVHGLSRPLGAHFPIQHGLVNAILLPAVTKFSLRGAIPRYAAVSHALGAAKDADSDGVSAGKLVLALEELNRSLHIGRLREQPDLEHGAFEAALPKLAADALASGCPQNNPVVPTADEIIALYREVW